MQLMNEGEEQKGILIQVQQHMNLKLMWSCDFIQKKEEQQSDFYKPIDN